MAKSLEPGFPPVSQLEDLVQATLGEAKNGGASSAEAGVSFGAGLNVTVRLGDVETLEYNRDRSLAVTVFFGQRKGSASTSDWSDQAIQDTVRAACAIAQHANEDDCAGLADAELMATEIPDLDLCHPWDLSAEQAIELALQCEDAARSRDDRITNSEGATVSTRRGISVYGNSHDFVGGYDATRHSTSCSVIANDDKGMQRDYWYTLARDSLDLDPPEVVGQRAADRTLNRLNAKRLKTGEVPVIYAAEIASGLLGHLVSAVSGGNLYRESSFLLDHMGKQIFQDHIQIREQPHLRKALGSSPFDNEGVATHDRNLVENGVLQGYVLSSYSARKLGMKTTGNAGGVHNLTIKPGEKNLESLLKEMGTGLLVTELMGQGVNIVTGDYSRGAAGFWVENGEIVYPVEEITIAGNLRDMFMRLVAVGNDVDTRGNIRTGSLMIEKMMVAGE
jgi:PmbA protein